MAGRAPDYQFHFLNKSTREKGKIGAAWNNDDGSIRIRLDPLIVLTSNTDLVLTLFKVNERDRKRYQNDQYDEDAYPT